MNVTFIGMAGAGKSYLGKKVARELDFDFVDSDDLLSEAFGGKGIQSLLEELGEEAYLEAESRLCIEATAGRDNMIISPAGSVIYVPAWIEHLRKISKVVYLDVPFPTVERRLAGAPPRAVIGLGAKTLRQLYDERRPLYTASADLVLRSEELSNAELLARVQSFVGY